VFLQQTSGDLQIVQGAVFPSSPVSVDIAPLAVAKRSWIECAAPSPFRATTRVRFHLTDAAAQGPVVLQVIDPRGRRVRELSVGAGALFPGSRSVEWDGRSDGGHPVAAGTYFLRLRTREGVAGGKVVRIR
jgi:flagellar hook assembly protein FlgD